MQRKKKSIYEIEIVPQFMSNQVGNEQYFNFFGYLSPKQSLFAFLHLYHLANTISVYDWGGLKGGNWCIFAHKYPLLPFTTFLEFSPPPPPPPKKQQPVPLKVEHFATKTEHFGTRFWSLFYLELLEEQ